MTFQAKEYAFGRYIEYLTPAGRNAACVHERDGEWLASFPNNRSIAEINQVWAVRFRDKCKQAAIRFAESELERGK